jgi:hypothetical protein
LKFSSYLTRFHVDFQRISYKLGNGQTTSEKKPIIEGYSRRQVLTKETKNLVCNPTKVALVLTAIEWLQY